MVSATFTHPTVVSPTPPAASHPPAVPYYMPIPRRLIEDLRDTPTAIGVFALLVRIFRTTGEPVPLSVGDLQVYDPSLSEGAGSRAFRRLITGQWVIAQRRIGHKSFYTPTWGLVHGVPRTWDLSAPSLGRPNHISFLRLDQNLLDVCMGRLIPHAVHPALVRRYIATPFLGIHEVGAYALALANIPVTNHRLEQLHLLNNGYVQPLPNETTILALASQREEHHLTIEGWRRTAFPVNPPVPHKAFTGQALFFVPPGQIAPPFGRTVGEEIAEEVGEEAGGEIAEEVGGVIGGVIACNAPTKMALEPSECRIPSKEKSDHRSHGVMYGMYGNKDGQETTTTPPTACSSQQTTEHINLVPGGGGEYTNLAIAADDQPQARAHNNRTGQGCAEHSDGKKKLQKRAAQSQKGSRAQSQKPQPQVAQITTVKTDDQASYTESTRLLLSIGVRRNIAISLGERPTEQVLRVISQARNISKVRDLAGWTVSALRDIPVDVVEPEPLKAPSIYPIYMHPGLTSDQRSDWILRFRAVSIPYQQRATLDRMFKEHPVDEEIKERLFNNLPPYDEEETN